MWKYIAGVKHPKRKTASDCSDEQSKGKRAAYEEKRDLKFLDKWKFCRPWLCHDDTEKHMYCDVCRRHARPGEKKSVFVAGYSSFKLESITAHEASKQHSWSAQCEIARRPREETDGGRALAALSQAQTERVVKLIRTAHAIAKHSKPFKDFEWISKLDKMKGLDIGDTYTTR